MFTRLSGEILHRFIRRVNDCRRNVNQILLVGSGPINAQTRLKILSIHNMKKSFLLAFSAASISFTAWQPSFEKAKEVAKQKHWLVLLNFSGSDWCGTCMRMRKEIFDSPVFAAMADSSLLKVNADFPRNKKNQLEKNVQQQNEMLAEKYNAGGAFPLTVLLDENGAVIKTRDGLPKEDAAAFAKQIKVIADAHK